MSSLRAERRRACQGKIRHISRRAALTHSASLRTKGEVRLRVYRCRWCGGWHVGHSGYANG